MAAEIKRPPTFLVGVALIAAIALIALAVIALVQYAGFAMQDELEQKVLTRPNPELAALHERETTRLSTYQWVDKKAGVARVPIDRALELTLRDWASTQGAKP